MSERTGSFWGNLMGGVKDIFSKDEKDKDTSITIESRNHPLSQKSTAPAKITTPTEQAIGRTSIPLESIKKTAAIPTPSEERTAAQNKLTEYRAVAQDKPILSAIFGKERTGKAFSNNSTLFGKADSLIFGGIADAYHAVRNDDLTRKGRFDIKRQDTENAFFRVEKQLEEQKVDKEIENTQNKLDVLESQKERLKQQLEQESANDPALKSLLDKVATYNEEGAIVDIPYTQIIKQLRDSDKYPTLQNLATIDNHISELLSHQQTVTFENMANSPVRANFRNPEARKEVATMMGNISVSAEDSQERALLLTQANAYLGQKRERYDRMVSSGQLTQEQADFALLSDFKNDGLKYIQRISEVFRNNRDQFTFADGTIDGDKLRDFFKDDDALSDMARKFQLERYERRVSANTERSNDARKTFASPNPIKQVKGLGLGLWNELIGGLNNLTESSSILFDRGTAGILGNNTRERFVDDAADIFDDDTFFGLLPRNNRTMVLREIGRGLAEDPTLFLSLPKSLRLAFKPDKIAGKITRNIMNMTSKTKRGQSIFKFANAGQKASTSVIANIDDAVDITNRIVNLGTKGLSQTFGVTNNQAQQIMRRSISALNEMAGGVPINILLEAKFSDGGDTQMGLNFGIDAAAGFIFPGVKRLSQIEGTIYDIWRTTEGSAARANLITKQFPFIDRDTARKMGESQVNEVVTQMSNLMASQKGETLALGINGLKESITNGKMDYKTLEQYISVLRGGNMEKVPPQSKDIFQRAISMFDPILDDVRRLAGMNESNPDFIALDAKVKENIGNIIDSYNGLFVQQIVSQRTASRLAQDTVGAVAQGIMESAGKVERNGKVETIMSEGVARTLALATLNNNSPKLSALRDIMKNLGYNDVELDAIFKYVDDIKQSRESLIQEGGERVKEIIKVMDEVDNFSEVPTEKIKKAREIAESDKENIAKVTKALSDTAPEKTVNREDFAESVGAVARSLGDAGKGADIKMLSAAGAMKSAMDTIYDAVLLGTTKEIAQFRKLYDAVSSQMNVIVDSYVNAKIKALGETSFTPEQMKETFFTMLGRTKTERESMKYAAGSIEDAINPLVDFVQDMIALAKKGEVGEDEATLLANSYAKYADGIKKGDQKKLELIIQNTKSQIPDFTGNTYSKLNKISVKNREVEPDSIPAVIVQGNKSGTIPPLQVLMNNIMKGNKAAIETLGQNPIYFHDEARKYLMNNIARFGDGKQLEQFMKVYNDAFQKLSKTQLETVNLFNSRFYDGETGGLLLTDKEGNSFIQLLSSLGEMFTINGVYAPPVLQIFKYLEEIPENEPLLRKLFNKITESSTKTASLAPDAVNGELPTTVEFLRQMGYEDYFDFYQALKKRAVELLMESKIDDTRKANDIIDPMLFNPQRNIDAFISTDNFVTFQRLAEETTGGNLMDAFIGMLNSQRRSSGSTDEAITVLDDFTKGFEQARKNLLYRFNAGASFTNGYIYDYLDKVYKFFSAPSNYADVAAKNAYGDGVLLFRKELDEAGKPAGLGSPADGFNEYLYKVLYRDISKVNADVSNSFVGNVISALGRYIKESMHEAIQKTEGASEALELGIKKLSQQIDNNLLSDRSGIGISDEITKFVDDFKKMVGVDDVDNARFNGFIEAVTDLQKQAELGGKKFEENSVLRRYIIEAAINNQEMISKSYRENRQFDTPEQVVARLKSYQQIQRNLDLNRIESLGIGIETDTAKVIDDIATQLGKAVNEGKGGTTVAGEGKIKEKFGRRIGALREKLKETQALAKELNIETNLQKLEDDLATLDARKILTAEQQSAVDFLSKVVGGFDMNAYVRLPQYQNIMNAAQKIMDSSFAKNDIWKEYYLPDKNGVIQTFSQESISKIDNFLVTAGLGKRQPELSRAFATVETNAKRRLSRTAAFGSESMTMKQYASKSVQDYYEITKDMTMKEIQETWNYFKLIRVGGGGTLNPNPELLSYFQKTFQDIDTFRGFSGLGKTNDIDAVVGNQTIMDYLDNRFSQENSYPAEVVNTLFGNWLYLDFKTINRLSENFGDGIRGFKTNMLLGGLTTKGYYKEGGSFRNSPMKNLQRKWRSGEFWNDFMVDAVINPINRLGVYAVFNVFFAGNQVLQQMVSNTVEATGILRGLSVDPKVVDTTLEMAKKYVGFDLYDVRKGDDVVQNITELVEEKKMSKIERGMKKVSEIISSPKFIGPYLADHLTKDEVMQSAVAAALYKYSEAGLGVNGVIGFQNQVGEMEDFVTFMNELYQKAGGGFANKQFNVNNFGQYTPRQFLIQNLNKMEGVTPDILKKYDVMEKFYKGEFTNFIGEIRTNAASFFVQDKTAELAGIPRLNARGSFNQKFFFAMQKWGIGKAAEYAKGFYDAFSKMGPDGVAKSLMLGEVNELNAPIMAFARQLHLVGKLILQMNKTTDDAATPREMFQFFVPALAGFSLSFIGGMVFAGEEKYHIDRASGENIIASLTTAAVAGLVSPSSRLIPYIARFIDGISAAAVTSRGFEENQTNHFFAVLIKELVLDKMFGMNKLMGSKGEVLADPRNVMSNFNTSQLGVQSRGTKDKFRQDSINYNMTSKIKAGEKDGLFLGIGGLISRAMFQGSFFSKFTNMNNNDEYTRNKLRKYTREHLGGFNGDIDYDASLLQKMIGTINGGRYSEVLKNPNVRSFSSEDAINALYHGGQIEVINGFTNTIESIILNSSKSSNLITAAGGEEYRELKNDILQVLQEQYRGKNNSPLVESDLIRAMEAMTRKGGIISVAQMMRAYRSGASSYYQEELMKKYGVSKAERNTQVKNLSKNTVAPDYLKEWRVLMDKSEDTLMRVVRPVIRNENEVMDALALQYMKHDPEFHITGIKNITEGNPIGSAAIVFETEKLNNINIGMGDRMTQVQAAGLASQMAMVDALSVVKVEDMENPKVQRNIQQAFKILGDSVDNLQNSVTNPVARFLIQSNMAMALASKLDTLRKKFGPETKEYLDKLNNTGELSGAAEYALSGLTDSIPMNLQTAFEMVSGFDTRPSEGGGKGRKLGIQNFKGKAPSFENYLKPLNQLSKIAAEGFNRPNQYEYSIVKNGPIREIKATPIPQRDPVGSLTRRDFGGTISTGKIKTPGLPVKKGRVISSKRRPIAIGGSKVYSRKIGGK